MARLETIIDGSAEGLETAATRAIGILEGLQKVADKLKIDLFQATTVEDLNAVGTALTAVTGRYNDYVNTALRGNSIWQDQQAAKALDTLDAKLRVVNGNAEIFGRTLATDKQEVRAYQAALDAMLKAGLDPTDARVKELTANINRLNAAIAAASQGRAANPFSGFDNASGIIGNLENRLRNLRQALRDATDTRQIISLNRRLRETQEELARMRGLGNQTVGMLNQLQEKAKQLRTQLRFAQSERELESLGKEIREVEGEIARLNRVAGVTNNTFGRDGRQSFNQFGLEFGRVIQDLPYAANNFGAVGNNVTRMVEVFPGYIAMLQATVVAQGRAVTSTNVLRAAFQSFFTGANAWLLAISAIVTAFTIWQQRQQAAAREAEKAAKATQTYKEKLDAFLNTLNGVNRAYVEGSNNALEETTRLDLLRRAIENVNLPMEDRLRYVAEIRKLYPTYFKDLSDEALLTGQAAAQYRILARDIQRAARARAAEESIVEYGSTLNTVEIRREKRQERLNELKEKEAELTAQIVAAGEQVPDLTADQLENIELLERFGNLLLKTNSEAGKAQLEYVKTQREINRLNAEAVEDFTAEQDARQNINDLQRFINNSLENGVDLLDETNNKLKTTAKSTKQAADYAGRMAQAFSQATNQEEVDSRTGLDALTEETRQKYEKAYDALDKMQTEWQAKYKEGTEERMRLDALATNYRIQLASAEVDELLRNEDEFNREAEEKRRKELAKRIDIEVDTQRRINERRSQTMIRALNNELKMWEKAAEERVKAMVEAGASETEAMAAQLREREALQQQYWERLEAIQQFERMERLANDFGEAFSRAFETSLSEGKNIFEQIYQEFRRLIIRMIAQQAAIEAANIFGRIFGVGEVANESRGSAGIGTLIRGIGRIFSGGGEGGSWLKTLSDTFSGSGNGGRFIKQLGNTFTSQQGGGGFLRTLGGLFSGLSRGAGGGGGGGWFGRILGGLFGGLFGRGFSSGNFPTGNFGGGNFPSVAPVPPRANFAPGVMAGLNGQPITLNAKIGHDAIYLSNKIGSQQNNRFFGGK